MTKPRKGHSATSVLSIRLTPDERQLIEQAAKESGAASLAEHIRTALLNADAPPFSKARRVSPATRQKLLAQLLRTLGELQVLRNLSELAKAARLGVLPATPDVVEDIRLACEAVMTLRDQLMRALGIRKTGSDGGDHDS